MPLPKTGWRIKNLIAYHKNPNTIDDTSNGIKSNDADLRVGKRSMWKSQTLRDIERPLLRRTSSNATTRTPRIQPQSTNKMAASSTSSLYSCDCDLATNREGSLSPLRARYHLEGLYHPPYSSRNNSNDTSKRLTFSDQQSLARIETQFSSTSTLTNIDTGSTSDLLEGLSIDPSTDENRPTRTFGLKGKGNIRQTSPNVDQLIRETDEAFRAVGAALVEAKVPTWEWYDREFNAIVNFSEPPRIPARNPRREELKKPNIMAIPLSEPELKRKKSGKKKKSTPRPLKTAPFPLVTTPTRWTFNEVTTNMADVFSGRKFRLEADEMLTPERMEEVKRSIQIKRARRASIESKSSVETDESTPTEPFHLESLSDRISAMQNNKFPPSPDRTPPEVPKSPKSVTEHLQDINCARMKFNNVSFPAPPRTPRRSSGPQRSSLPTIPEVAPLKLRTEFTRKRSIYGSRPLESHILLPSTQYTLAAALYRQGPIRVERPPEKKDCISPVEEQLDWTAFQMAISGMGEGSSECNWEDDEAEIDEIVAWWQSYGFASYGRMERHDPSTRTPTKQATSSHSSKQNTRNRTMCGKEQKFSLGLGNKSRNAREDVDTSKIVDRLGNSDINKRRPSAESLPPSPMFELVLPAKTKNDDIIPMGFNLGHDLGDFLNWEAHHVQTLVYE